MEERYEYDPLMQRVKRRQAEKQRQAQRRQGHWFQIRTILIMLSVLAVLIGTTLLFGSGTEEGPTEPVMAQTQPPTEPATQVTEPPTEVPTQAPTIPPVGGVIYLTFDDGPGAQTPRLLEILEQYDAKATFFVVNTPFASTIADIAAGGHTLAMHTATHDFQKIYSSEKAYFADLEKIEAVIEEYAGYRPNILRFPGGGSNTVSRKYCQGIMTLLTRRVQEKGYLYYDWNVDSDDAGSARTAEAVFENVVRGCSTRTSSIVLMHDIKSYTVDAIEQILIWGQTHGYTFEAITEDTPQCHHGVQN